MKWSFYCTRIEWFR